MGVETDQRRLLTEDGPRIADEMVRAPPGEAVDGQTLVGLTMSLQKIEPASGLRRLGKGHPVPLLLLGHEWYKGHNLTQTSPG
jgi:hypothetical protein